MRFELDGKYIILKTNKKEVRLLPTVLSVHKLYDRISDARKETRRFGKEYNIFKFAGLGVTSDGKFTSVFEKV